jgi:hypothetical protein
MPPTVERLSTAATDRTAPSSSGSVTVDPAGGISHEECDVDVLEVGLQVVAGCPGRARSR